MINENELEMMELTDEMLEAISGGVKWYRVKYRGGFGWVNSRYSKKQ